MRLIFFFFFFQIIYIIQSNIVIQFTRLMSIIKEQTYSLDLEYVNQRIDNPFKTYIRLGDPPQYIPGFLKTDEFNFFLSNYECPQHAIYYRTGSKDFIYITPKEYFDDNDITDFQFYDSLFLDECNNCTNLSETNTIKVLNYSLNVNNNMKGQQCFHIGSQLIYQDDKLGASLIDKLYEKEIIKSYLFEYKIINEDNIYLHLGLNLDEESKKNYKFIKSIHVYESIYYNNIIWGLKFDFISINNYATSYNKETNALFDINLGCFLGNSDFNEYFKNYLKDNDLYVEPKLFEQEYYVYFFAKNTKGFEKMKDFILSFYNKDLNYNFTLNYTDLFLEKENGYYFLVAFEKNYRSEWKLGFPFFDKYKFIFDHNSKSVGFFCPDGCSPLNGNNNIQQNNSNVKNILLIIGIILISSFILIIGIFIGKKLFEARKRRANELLDLYEYKGGDNAINDNSEKVNK